MIIEAVIYSTYLRDVVLVSTDDELGDWRFQRGASYDLRLKMSDGTLFSARTTETVFAVTHWSKRSLC
jgi:hypothetical protein